MTKIDSVKEFERVILTGDASLLGPALQFLESNALAATSSYTQVGQSFECIKLDTDYRFVILFLGRFVCFDASS